MAGMWVYNPHSGGCRIPKHKQEPIRQRILKHAEAHYGGKYTRIEVRFRGKHCYIDAYVEPDVPKSRKGPFPDETREEYVERLRNTPLHLCRLLYHGNEDAWSVAFYTYSQEKYERSMFPNGTDTGPPEDAFDVGAMYFH